MSLETFLEKNPQYRVMYDRDRPTLTTLIKNEYPELSDTAFFAKFPELATGYVAEGETSIVRTDEGWDLTEGTGFDPWWKNIGNSVVGLTNAILNTDFNLIDEDVAVMTKAIRNLRVTATIQMMDSVTGKASEELRKLLESTQVPAASILQNPEVASENFKAARNLADFFIRTGEGLLSAGDLTADQILSINKEIKGVRALIPEYDALINAYGAKYNVTPGQKAEDFHRFFGPSVGLETEQERDNILRVE